MSLKNLIHRNKTENLRPESKEETASLDLAGEDYNQITMETLDIYEMMPFGGFLNGIWYFY